MSRSVAGSGKTTRESSCNALPAAFRESSLYIGTNKQIPNDKSIMDKIIADKFAFVLVILCCFSAFIANIIHSTSKLLPSSKCSLEIASIIGPVESLDCPFPLGNSVVRISISGYLFCFLIIIIAVLKAYDFYGSNCCSRFSLNQCIACTVNVLSISHYLCFISLIMDCYSIFTAYKFSKHKLETNPLSSAILILTFALISFLNRVSGKFEIIINGKGQSSDASKYGLSTIIITNLLVLCGCATMRCIIRPWFNSIKQSNELREESPSKNDDAPNSKKKAELDELKGIRIIQEDYLWDAHANQQSNSSENSMASMSEGSSITKVKSRSHSGTEMNIIRVKPMDTNNKIQIVNKENPMTLAKMNRSA